MLSSCAHAHFFVCMRPLVCLWPFPEAARASMDFYSLLLPSAFLKLVFRTLYFSVCSSCVRLSSCVFVRSLLGWCDCCYLETAARSSLVNRWQRRDRQLVDVEGGAIMSNPLMLQFFGVFERMASGEGHWRCGPTQRHLWLLQVGDGLNVWKEEIKSIRVKKKGEWQAEHIFQEGGERETKTWWIDGLRRIDQ